MSTISTTTHLKWEEFILHSNFTKYYEVIITEQNDINSILTAASTPIYNGSPTAVVPNRASKSVQIPSSFLGKKLYVTFRHHQPNNTNGTGILFIDNVSIETTLSTSKHEKREVITIFPNPTNDVLNFKGLKKIEYVEVINNLGKTVMKIESPIENTINIKSLNSGLYALKIYSENKISIKKVLKQKF